MGLPLNSMIITRWTESPCKPRSPGIANLSSPRTSWKTYQTTRSSPLVSVVLSRFLKRAYTRFPSAATVSAKFGSMASRNLMVGSKGKSIWCPGAAPPIRLTLISKRAKKFKFKSTTVSKVTCLGVEWKSPACPLNQKTRSPKQLPSPKMQAKSFSFWELRPNGNMRVVTAPTWIYPANKSNCSKK